MTRKESSPADQEKSRATKESAARIGKIAVSLGVGVLYASQKGTIEAAFSHAGVNEAGVTAIMLGVGVGVSGSRKYISNLEKSMKERVGKSRERIKELHKKGGVRMLGLSAIKTVGDFAGKTGQKAVKKFTGITDTWDSIKKSSKQRRERREESEDAQATQEKKDRAARIRGVAVVVGSGAIAITAQYIGARTGLGALGESMYEFSKKTGREWADDGKITVDEYDEIAEASFDAASSLTFDAFDDAFGVNPQTEFKQVIDLAARERAALESGLPV